MPIVSKNARVCETCGSPIETTSSGDLGCMVCLIDAALDPDAEESDVAFASALDQVGAYTIERRVDGSAWELGHGAMGVTYCAIDKVLDRPVALKIISTDLGSRSAEARERFMREARAAAALRHPNVATVYQFGIREETGQFFYAMELVEGETLEERVRRLGPLGVLTTIDIALQVTAGLAAAEERGLVHRDLKPGNLMLVATDHERPDASTQRGGYKENEKLVVKVIDFGVAKAVAEKTNAMALTHGGFVGTPAFASPEQFTNAPVDVRSDIYSLGATLWFSLTGQMPFSGRTVEEIRDARRSKPLPVEQLKAAHVPHRFVALLMSMLAIEPAARPAGAAELSTKLQKIRASVMDRGKNFVRLALASTVILILGVSAFFVFPSLRTHPAAAGSASNPATPEKSIAVLPFENLSGDPDNAYFADGIQEEILTRLASIGDLKVISRSSTQRYQSKPRNLAEIAKQLGVTNILEGSVQKAGDQVRVNVQLVNAQSDSHLWAETYDRKLTDIFGVESEIAKGIAASLQAKLTGREEQALAVKPTSNPEAYDAYLRGRALQARGFYAIGKAIGFYELAVQLDPNFALAWAWLSRADALYFTSWDTTPTRRDAAKKALENAQKLQPNLPETQLALGYYQHRVLGDDRLAKSTFRLISKLLPGSSEVPYALGAVARREGNWDESVAYFEQGLALDPRNPELLDEAATTYAHLRQFPTALKLYDRALDIIPNDPKLMSFKARIYQAQGNLQKAAKILSQIDTQTLSEEGFRTKLVQLRLERNHDEAIQLLQTHLAQFHFPSEFDKGVAQVNLAFAQHLGGDSAGAKVTAEQARITLEQLCQSQPNNFRFARWLSQSYAALGNKDLALKEAERAIMLSASARDRWYALVGEENLAAIQTFFGVNNRAIATLTRLLQTPGASWVAGGIVPLTPALLRLDPFWDPLRSDPRFQELCEEKIDKSIALLPFENLSRDPDNAYFAEGIQEEILTRLAGIGDLKVISRSSTQRYQSKPRNLSEIAKQLGVANILEGSVQKAADQVRVNVQLINAQTDSHLWAETYDRKLTDIFGVESEIAKRIAESLQAKLSGREEQALAVKPTNNPEAYDAYLRGRAFQAHGPYHSGFVGKAIDFYERAVKLDPNFALAWAWLSRAEASFYFGSYDTSATRRDAAKRALDNAQRLQPNLPETQLALGYYQYQVLRDYGLAKTTFRLVSKMLPHSSEVPYALGEVAQREGNWDESIAYFEQGLALDPHNTELLKRAAFTYTRLRRFAAALKLFDRALDIIPTDRDLMANKARIYQAEGNLQEAAKLLENRGADSPAKLTQLMLERNYGEVIRLLQTQLAQFHFDSEFDKGHAQVGLAFAQRFGGDSAGAMITAEQARNTLEPLCKSQPNNDKFSIFLSLSYAALGNKDAALKEAERAIMLLPTAKDRLHGPTYEENLALIQTMFAENSQAISTLTRLLQTPYSSWRLYGDIVPLTPALLRLDPLWDPLRADPAFQKLCEEK